MATNLGELGDSIYRKNAEIAAIDAQRKDLDAEKRDMENTLMEAMAKAGTSTVRGQLATITIAEHVKPQIVDIEKLYQFVLRKKALHLFERRIATTAYREIREQLGNKPVPGLSEFTVTKLNVRKV
jgi:hypothetical protein